MAQHPGPHGEFAHELLHHYARCDAHDPGVEEEERGRCPGYDRQEPWGHVSDRRGLGRHRTAFDEFLEPIHSRAHSLEESEESAGQLGVAVDASRNRWKPRGRARRASSAWPEPPPLGSAATRGKKG